MFNGSTSAWRPIAIKQENVQITPHDMSSAPWQVAEQGSPEYAPELHRTPYEKASSKNLVQMSPMEFRNGAKHKNVNKNAIEIPPKEAPKAPKQHLRRQESIQIGQKSAPKGPKLLALNFKAANSLPPTSPKALKNPKSNSDDPAIRPRITINFWTNGKFVGERQKNLLVMAQSIADFRSSLRLPHTSDLSKALLMYSTETTDSEQMPLNHNKDLHNMWAIWNSAGYKKEFIKLAIHIQNTPAAVSLPNVTRTPSTPKSNNAMASLQSQAMFGPNTNILPNGESVHNEPNGVPMGDLQTSRPFSLPQRAHGHIKNSKHSAQLIPALDMSPTNSNLGNPMRQGLRIVTIRSQRKVYHAGLSITESSTVQQVLDHVFPTHPQNKMIVVIQDGVEMASTMTLAQAFPNQVEIELLVEVVERADIDFEEF